MTSLVLRPATAGDGPFLRDLFVRTRAPRLAAAGLPPAALEALLAEQAALEPRARALSHPEATNLVALDDGVPVGRILIDRSGPEDRLVDLAIVPEAQGRGRGAELLRRLIGEAAAAGRALSLSVDRTNTGALRLYERLGFGRTGESETDVFLRHASTSREET